MVSWQNLVSKVPKINSRTPSWTKSSRLPWMNGSSATPSEPENQRCESEDGEAFCGLLPPVESIGLTEKTTYNFHSFGSNFMHFRRKTW